jgi:hypothetical protein
VTPFPADIAQDFAAVVDGLEHVTVSRHDPDTGEELDSSGPVTCLAGDRVDEDAGTAAGGQAAGEKSGFTLVACEVGFEPHERDRVTTSDGVAWVIDAVSVEGGGTLYVCDATRMQTGAQS